MIPATRPESPVPRGAAIAAAALSAHLPALAAGFVFDDHVLIEDNRLLRGSLWGLFTSTTFSDYWPVTWASFWAEWRLFGAEHPAAWHAVALALHAAVAVLLWRVLTRLRVPGAFLAGLLFAVHPVAVESAVWVSEQKNTLSAALLLGAVLAWLRFEERRAWLPWAAALGLFALAALAKVAVVMLPIALIVLAWARRRTIGRRDLLATAPFFAVALAAGGVNLWFQRHNAMAGGWAPARGLGERLGTAGWALASYLRAAFVPIGLPFVHSGWPVGPDTALFWTPAIALAAGAAALLLLRDRWPWLSSARRTLGWHALMLAPVLGLVDIAYFQIAPVSNHLHYLALLGPVALGAAGLDALARRVPAARWAGLAAVAALGAVSFGRARAFHDDLALWQAAVARTPQSAFARAQLSGALAGAGRYPEALAELEQAARVATDPADAHRYQALALLRGGLPAQAAEEARQALAAGDPEVQRDAAYVLAQAGRPGEAVPVFRRLAAEAPNASDYTYWLGAALARDGRLAEAAGLLEAWCDTRPGHPMMERALAVLLARAGREDAARVHAALALEASPDDPAVAARLAAWKTGGE